MNEIADTACVGLSPACSECDVIRSYESLGPVRLGLGEHVRRKSVMTLNRLLADSLAIRDLYKKSH
jgi:starvation-inducible DNA-binding protein